MSGTPLIFRSNALPLPASVFLLARPRTRPPAGDSGSALAPGRAASAKPAQRPRLSQEVWGIRFPNPVGLAAGYDKNAEVPLAWSALGFGFAELGTLTARAQPGNPKPRIFRLEEDRACINRLGFNNDGAASAAQRLGRLLTGWRCPIPLGFNIGKSRTTPLKDAVDDYLESGALLLPFATILL